MDFVTEMKMISNLAKGKGRGPICVSARALERTALDWEVAAP